MRPAYKYIILIITACILVLAALMLGTKTYGPAGLYRVLTDGNSGIDRNIIINIRLPRVFMTLIVGAALSVSGVIFQAILKNPLADPYIIGVSGGAALGAAGAMVLSMGYPVIVLFSFIGSMGAVTVVYLLSRRLRLGTTSLILSGVALSFVLSSAVLLIFSLSRSDQVHRAVMWLMGDFSLARYDMLVPVSVITMLFITISFLFSHYLNVISFGELFSRNLGVTHVNMRYIFWLAALLSAVSVSLCGVIGFVGLIIPHLMRGFFGPDHYRLIPSAAIGGGIFLMLADTVGRTIAPPYEIPVGIITGFLGGLFFLFYLIRKGG